MLKLRRVFTICYSALATYIRQQQPENKSLSASSGRVEKESAWMIRMNGAVQRANDGINDNRKKKGHFRFPG